MTTSGSTDWTLARDTLIRQSLLNLRVIDPQLSTPAQDILDGTVAANALIKSWQLDGVFMWLNQDLILHLQDDYQSYTIGPSGDHCCLLSDAVSTNATNAVASTETDVTVDSVAGIEVADNIGMEIDGGGLEWSTVGSIVGSVVTIDDALTGSIPAGGAVYTYTTKTPRPTSLLKVLVRDSGDVDSQVTIHTSRDRFFDITDKTTSGRVLDVYYDPLITNGRLYTWPVCDDVTDRLLLSVQRVIEDLDSSTDNFDGPVEAIPALIWGLSAWLAPQYGVDLTVGKGAMIAAQAAGQYNNLKKFYTDREPIYLRPAR